MREAQDEAMYDTSQEAEIIHLTPEGQRQIADAVLNPPAATAALQRAAKRYRQLIDSV